MLVVFIIQCCYQKLIIVCLFQEEYKSLNFYRPSIMILNYSTNLNCSDNFFFAILYQPHWSMTLGILTSLLNIAIVTPMSCSIIWYERFGSDYRRTLINQLVSSICWNIVLQNLITVPLEIMLTIVGPLGDMFCSIHMFLKYGSMFHIYTILTFMTLVKYLSIFVFNNPTGIQNNFWHFFINLIAVIALVITQTAYVIVPGKNPINFYVCIGQDPSIVHHQQFKKNYPMISVLLINIVWYLFVFTKVKIFKKKIPSQTIQGQTSQANIWTILPVNQAVEKNTLANLGTIAMTFTTTIPLSIAYLILNHVSPKMLAVYPNFMILHFFHHGFGFILNLFLLLIFFSQSSSMRNALSREVKSILKWE